MLFKSVMWKIHFFGMPKGFLSDYYFIDQKIAEENPEAYRVTEEMITELTEKLQNQNKERREQNN